MRKAKKFLNDAAGEKFKPGAEVDCAQKVEGSLTKNQPTDESVCGLSLSRNKLVLKFLNLTGTVVCLW